ncbi:hypothetical protein [Bradyrhizobium sp. Leo121]|uniref:hypothetical protein n=1 Tax=Bradyrhizobium sp. Leo121 TaxID=1571195 RepID=UPI001028EA77|nr:hypothetical protein [Bradyrhizobium sp. Leo121]RZN32292.1 hypothetical protein CWO90_13870 [Bradyrhizobium sp. Leo121]
MKNTGLLVMALALAALEATSVAAQQSAPSLRFGMKPDEVARTLGVPLTFMRGRPGNELYLALPNVKGSALSSRSDGLYLQFRRGKLAGWKGDWGTIRP